jgi:ribosomal-protein-alanine acetyltransferase
VISNWQTCPFEALSDAQWQSVARIEQANHIKPWSLKQLQESHAAGYRANALLDTHSQVVAYSIFMVNVDEWELLNITVDVQHQSKGLARCLMNQGIAAARLAQSSGIFLEVRPSNRAAFALYNSMGFKSVGLRKNYYYTLDPTVKEDACIMRLNLEPTIYNAP